MGGQIGEKGYLNKIRRGVKRGVKLVIWNAAFKKLQK
jgi:hypothetical protein